MELLENDGWPDASSGAEMRLRLAAGGTAFKSICERYLADGYHVSAPGGHIVNGDATILQDTPSSVRTLENAGFWEKKCRRYIVYRGIKNRLTPVLVKKHGTPSWCPKDGQHEYVVYYTTPEMLKRDSAYMTTTGSSYETAFREMLAYFMAAKEGCPSESEMELRLAAYGV